jgi:hypothetical protein
MHLDVLRVHPVARRDRLRREPDDLIVFAHRLALRDRRDRHLVSAHHARARGHAGGRHALHDRIDRDDHIVIWRKADGAGRAHRWLFQVRLGPIPAACA